MKAEIQKGYMWDENGGSEKNSQCKKTAKQHVMSATIEFSLKLALVIQKMNKPYINLGLKLLRWYWVQ